MSDPAKVPGTTVSTTSPTPHPPAPGDGARYASDRRLRIDVVTIPDGRQIRYLSRQTPAETRSTRNGDV